MDTIIRLVLHELLEYKYINTIDYDMAFFISYPISTLDPYEPLADMGVSGGG